MLLILMLVHSLLLSQQNLLERRKRKNVAITDIKRNIFCCFKDILSYCEMTFIVEKKTTDFFCCISSFSVCPSFLNKTIKAILLLHHHIHSFVDWPLISRLKIKITFSQGENNMKIRMCQN